MLLCALPDRKDDSNMEKKDNTSQGKVTAMEAAAKYLSSRMRTSSELREHLIRKGYSSDEADETVNMMTGYRYIDDYQYSLRYYEYNREKHRGSLRAARELAEKGVDAETIKYAREDFLYSGGIDEYADALEIALKEISAAVSYELFETDSDEERETGFTLDEKLAAKIARKLDAKGFEKKDIFRVLDDLRRRYD